MAIMAITLRGINPQSANGLARVSPEEIFSADLRIASDSTRLPAESLEISIARNSGTPLCNRVPSTRQKRETAESRKIRPARES